MTVSEPNFVRQFFGAQERGLNALAWNRGQDQHIIIDETRVPFPANTVLALNVSHTFRFERSADVVIWQFNKPFYCIVTHDSEVSCYGLLLYGWRETIPIQLTPQAVQSLGLLVDIFKEEFQNRDNIQGEMLRVLLKRLIITLTRLVKTQANVNTLSTGELDTIRQFNLLVENHYKKYHQVQDYAGMMFKSPKTLSNLFARYSEKTPLQIIADRIFTESKRLVLYSDLSASEIGYELGFEEPAHFSRFFKKMAGMPPSVFKQQATVKTNLQPEA